MLSFTDTKNADDCVVKTTEWTPRKKKKCKEEGRVELSPWPFCTGSLMEASRLSTSAASQWPRGTVATKKVSKAGLSLLNLLQGCK